MNSLKGYIFAAIAAASYGTNPIFAIPLYHEGISVSSVLFMRYAMAVAIMFAFTMIKSPKSLVIKPKHIGVLAFMGILMVLSSIGLFASYKYLSAGIASTLSPIITFSIVEATPLKAECIFPSDDISPIFLQLTALK